MSYSDILKFINRKKVWSCLTFLFGLIIIIIQGKKYDIYTPISKIIFSKIFQDDVSAVVYILSNTAIYMFIVCINILLLFFILSVVLYVSQFFIKSKR